MKTINNVDDLSDDLCLYCPLDDDEKGTHGVPNGYISCEGRCCQEAYEIMAGITNCMESIIIKEIEMMLELPLHERQKAYFQDLLNAAKPVKIVPAADVLEDYELDYIRHVIKPKPKECYRNSHLLCEAFPERILYCEGKTNVPIPIDHAFNKVGDAYIDITFEFALHENPSIYEYVTFGEYDAKTIRKAVLETGYYGEIYKWLYYQTRK